MIDLLIDPLAWISAALIAAILLALFQRHCARCAVILATLLMALILLASPIFANRWLGTLEDQYSSAACKDEALAMPVVALAGGYSGGYSNLGKPSRLSNSSKNRALAAAQITPAQGKLILSGGSIRISQSKEAEAMAELIGPMLADGVELILETESTDTHSNAIAVGLLLEQMQLERKVVLISSASHLPRAVATFKQQGFDVCAHSVDPMQDQSQSLTAFIPHTAAMLNSKMAIHEWTGIAYYRHMGWN